MGNGYGFSDLSKQYRGQFSGVLKEGTYTYPSGLECFGLLAMQICIYFLMALYLDTVLDNNRGVGKNFNFLC